MYQPNALSLLQRCMKAYGIKGEIIEMTISGDSDRGSEIQHYLDNNPDISKFVIIDDDSDMGELLPHLIQTKFEDGLQDTHAEKIIEILNKE